MAGTGVDVTVGVAVGVPVAGGVPVSEGVGVGVGVEVIASQGQETCPLGQSGIVQPAFSGRTS